MSLEDHLRNNGGRVEIETQARLLRTIPQDRNIL
jgi:hypothetical protein